ncbi:MAG: ABC transporter substrate-binding protein [Synergistaceae bacterium]|nr:ABC transporter substrate-binding protein [Synergistaceae bacterium]MBQ3450418.1 ABC transporter substrate-binding protein [Synergistaceae bacterium]MBQ6111562.1 ABC transporter substrate-binding protein [Synergistaceae bacterium]
MKKFMMIMISLVVLVSLSCVSFAVDKPKVTIYTSMYEDIIEAMTETLREKFPNYDIEFFYGGTGTLQAKIAAELDTKKLGCDMLMVADPSYSLELKAMGVLHPYISKEADNLALEYDKEGYWYPVRNLNMVLAYNPEKYKKEDLPQTFKDFAYSEAMKNAISMSNPLTSGTALIAISALKDKYGYEYFDKLGENHVMIESGSVALTKLETGECKVIMILEESVLKKREEEDSELAVIYPTDGVICVPSPIMTIKDELSAHKNAKICEELTDWFLSPEGQSYIVKGWMHSVLKNPPAVPYDSIQTQEIFSQAMPVDWERCLKERTELRTNFEERVKSAK